MIGAKVHLGYFNLGPTLSFRVRLSLVSFCDLDMVCVCVGPGAPLCGEQPGGAQRGAQGRP